MSGEPVNNLAILEGRFYAANPADYLLSRLQLLLLAAGRAKELRDLLDVGVHAYGVSFEAKPGSDDEPDLEAYVVIDSQQLLHHASETLVRLFLAHLPSGGVPAIEVGRRKSFRDFKAEVERTFVADTPAPEAVAWVCLGRATNDHALDGWDDAIEGLQSFLRAYAEVFLQRAAMYNAGKHGLCVVGGQAALAVEGLMTVEGPSVEYIEHSRWENNERDWTTTTQWVDMPETFGLIHVAVQMIEAIWEFGAARRTGRQPPKQVFYPAGLRRDALRSAGTPGLHRMGWTLVVESRKPT